MIKDCCVVFEMFIFAFVYFYVPFIEIRWQITCFFDYDQTDEVCLLADNVLSVFTFIVGVTVSVLHKIPYKIFGKSVNFIFTTTISFLAIFISLKGALAYTGIILMKCLNVLLSILCFLYLPRSNKHDRKRPFTEKNRNIQRSCTASVYDACTRSDTVGNGFRIVKSISK
jgi:hypothetical protein